MIKNYFYTLAVLLSVFSSHPAFSQITANDDTFTINGVSGGYGNGVRLNDVINGNPGSQVPCNSTVLTQISTTNPGVYVDTFCGLVTVAQGTPVGTYYIEYQICIAGTSVCDTATVTVNVCGVTPPVIENFTPLSCLAETSAITVGGLPANGTWTLTYINSDVAPEITGTGTTTTVTLPAGGYSFRVTDSEGCISAATDFYIYPPNDMEGELIGTFVDVNSDGIVNVGDEIFYAVSISNTSDCPITDIEIIEASLEFNDDVIANLSPNTTDNTTYTATYTITQQDINNGYASNYAFISGDINDGQAYTKAFGDFPLDIQDGIKMIAFIDENENGVKDPNEDEFANGEFTYQLNDGSQVNVYNNSGIHTIYETNPVNTYDIGFEINNQPCAEQYVIDPSAYANITVPALSGLTNYYFPVTNQSCTDLQAYIYGQLPVPGFAYTNTVIIVNQGNEPIAAGSVTFTHDPAVTIDGVSEVSAVITSNGFTYAFTNLQPYEVRYITVTMSVPALPAVALGDILISSVAASVPEGDINTDNNSYTLNQEVVGAYDPNDKAESHGGQIVFENFTENDYLTYTIRFENEGTANAQTVRIEDILDVQLDAATVRMIDASHNYVLERNGSELEWVFNNIQLPPSQEGTDVGKGYIMFQVKPLPGYEIGTVIENEAGIYFDTNPVIVTNTVTTEFTDALNTSDHSAQNIQVYPNPVKNILNFGNLTGLTTIEIYNQLGQLVLTQEVNSSQATVDMANFANGIYLVNIQAGGSVKSVKIIKG